MRIRQLLILGLLAWFLAGFSQPTVLSEEAVKVRTVEVFGPAASAPTVRLAAADELGQDDAGEFVRLR